uniref:VQ domain-containing protein n=1 Tax=Oryza meridionalis TaxID=40149 RepID=A0A0E0EGC8_9ORYZ
MDALSCLALLPCAAFTDADITRALHFSSSMPDTSSSPSSSSSAAFLADFCGSGGFLVSAPPPAITCESVLVADSARPSPAGPARRQQQLGLGPAGGRAGKRRSRASKRAPTTYISTDPANFRLMVQHVTGVQADQASLADGAGILPTTTAPFDASSSLNLLDTFAAANPLLQAEQAAALQQQPCFPTLDSSWSAVMYDGSDIL